MDKIEELKTEIQILEVSQNDPEVSLQLAEIDTLNPTSNLTSKAKVLMKSKNFWIETLIFIISVLGALCVAFGIMLIGFLLWLVSNTISILYFIKQKQYPLSLQQMVFLITTCIGVYNNV